MPTRISTVCWIRESCLEVQDCGKVDDSLPLGRVQEDSQCTWSHGVWGSKKSIGNVSVCIRAYTHLLQALAAKLCCS